MSTKVYKRGQLHWFKTGFKIIANRRQAELDSPDFAEFIESELIERQLAAAAASEKSARDKSQTKVDKDPNKAEKEAKKSEKEAKRSAEERTLKIEMRIRKRDRAKWRLGLNLYKCGDFFEAYALLEYIASGGAFGAKARQEGRPEILDVRSDVHLYAARCCKELYHHTKLHYHLEAGYRHYKNCIEMMGSDLSTMFKLPRVLYELALLLESYGAFESALQLYSKILTNFPMYRGYFDSMYRTAVVGKVLAERVANPKEREELLNKCIDMYQFLLEAVPPSITKLGNP
jgi:tetratricopeptide (TPR) repeat protein